MPSFFLTVSEFGGGAGGPRRVVSGRESLLGQSETLVGGLDVANKSRCRHQDVFDVEDLVALTAPLFLLVGENDTAVFQLIKGGIELCHLVALAGVVKKPAVTFNGGKRIS